MRTRSSGPPNLEDSFASAESDFEEVNMAFDTENGTDADGAQAKMGSIKTVFDPKDPEFFFLDLEAAMAFIGIKSQYTKQICLMSLLPPEVKRELKATIKASTNNNGYKKLKDAIAYFCGDSANCPWVKRINPRPQPQSEEQSPPD